MFLIHNFRFNKNTFIFSILPQNISVNLVITGVTDYFTTSSFYEVFILFSKTNNNTLIKMVRFKTRLLSYIITRKRLYLNIFIYVFEEVIALDVYSNIQIMIVTAIFYFFNLSGFI